MLGTPLFTFRPQTSKCLFTIDWLNQAIFELAITGIQHIAHLGQLGAITSHGVLDKFAFITAALESQLFQLCFQFRRKMDFHKTKRMAY